jgi:hypothetical protein
MTRTENAKRIVLSGRIVGSIWMPAAECEKDFRLELERIPRDSGTRTYPGIAPRSMEITCLRDALLHITNDGDFQSASIAEAWLEVTVYKGNKRITRMWELRGNDGNADCYSREDA